MRRTGFRMVRAAMVLLVTAAAACATSPEPAADPSAAVGATDTQFIIQNNHTDGRDMIVYLEPQGRGERHRLGTAPAGQTATFNHTPERGYYELIVAHNMGDMRSDRFNIPGPSTVRWVLNTNRLTVSGR